MTGLDKEARRDPRPLDNAFGSAVLVVLLISEVAALVMGAGTVFFASIVAAWLVLLVVVGFEDVLDAGCLFMLVSLGIVVVVDLAGDGGVPLLS